MLDPDDDDTDADDLIEPLTVGEFDGLLAEVRDAAFRKGRAAQRADTLRLAQAMCHLNGDGDKFVKALAALTKGYDEDHHVKRNHGKFAHTEGGHGLSETATSGADVHGSSSSGGSGVPASSQGVRGADSDPDARARTLAARIKEVPAVLARRVSEFVKARYAKLAERYGETGAKAVLGAMILLTPVPLPGTSLIPVALAEAVLRIRQAVGALTKAVADLSADEVRALARDLLHDLYAEMGEPAPVDGLAARLAESEKKAFLKSATHKDGEEWETNGRRYRRTGGKTIRIGKGEHDAPAPAPASSPARGESHTAPTVEPVESKPEANSPTERELARPAKPTAPIDWKHKDAEHPIAKAVAADPNATGAVRMAEEHAELVKEYRATKDTQDALFRKWQTTVGTAGEPDAKKAWLAAVDAHRPHAQKLEAANEKVRAALLEHLKTDDGVKLDVTPPPARSWWNPLKYVAVSKETLLAEHKGTQRERMYADTVKHSEAAVETAKGVISAVFESRGKPLGVEVGYSTDGRGFQKPKFVLGVLNRTAVIGMGISFDRTSAEDSAIHEMGHVLETEIPDVGRRAREFMNYRLGNEKAVDMGTIPGAEVLKGEKGRKDSFDRAFEGSSAYYVGKVYSGGGTEIVSMGLSKLYRDPVGFLNQDPEYAGFIIGLLRRKP